MNIYFKTMLLILLTTKAFDFASAKVPYEKCNHENDAYTENILKYAERDYLGDEITEACTECLLGAADRIERKVLRTFKNLNESLKNHENNIPADCFFSSASKAVNKKGSRNFKQYYYCDNPLSKSHSRTMTGLSLYPRRVCLSRGYINTTAKSFNYMANCLGFSDIKEKKNLFKLFNHESYFILNNRSESGARCYGQLVGGTIEHIDKMLYHKNREVYKPYSEIHEKALKKCPGLNSKLIIPKEILNTPKNERSHKKFNAMQKKSKPTCRTTQHPYTCFFYSMFVVESNRLRYNKNQDYVVESDMLPKNTDINKEDFLLPIKLPEVLSVKGTFKRKRDGATVKADWIFSSGRDLNKTLRRFEYDVKELQIEKVNMYKKEDAEKIKQFTIFTAHNGGGGVISIYLEGFLRNLKEGISHGCRSSTAKSCKYRQKILNREFLDFKSYSKDFSAYLKSSYKGTSSRKREVSRFYENLVNSQKYLTNKSNQLSRSLRRLHKKNPEVSEEDINSFIEESQEQCSDF